MMPDFDRWLTTPPEPKTTGRCGCCGAELYEGCEYVRDRSSDEWYCDDTCYVNKQRESGDLVTDVIE
jgi:hypothetical protein